MVDSFKKAILEIKEAYSISEYIQQSGVQLKQQGHTAKGLCPFHSEKSPSFTVNDHFQNYRCFGCGASGDLISYVEKTENLEFFEAVKKLAEDKNIEIDLGKQKQDGVDYKSLRECLKEAANFYVKEFRKLSADHPARTEITKRGLTEKKMLYGYAPERRGALLNHLKEKGFDEKTMLQAGVVSKFTNKETQKEFLTDFWSGRLMFVITDVTGKPIGFSGRKLYESDKRGKYVNSPDGPLFDKSSALFNLANAKKKAAEDKKVFVNEGQFDVAALVEAGFENTVASSGTAFTEKQGMILRRLVTEEGKIVFCFDPDVAGIKAAEKVFQNIPLIHSQAEIVLLPEGYDPSDYRQEFGNEKLGEALENSVPIIEFVLAQELKRHNMDDAVSSSQYVSAAASILKTVTNSVLRDQYVRNVALDSFVGIEEVRKAIRQAKPLVEAKEMSEVVEEAAPRYEEKEEEETTNEQIFALIEDSERYAISARLIALAFQERRLLNGLKKIHRAIPKDFFELLNEYGKLEPGKPVISEYFTNVELAERLINNNFFPFLHLMDEEAKEKHFVSLSERLTKKQITAREKRVRRETIRKLGKDTSASSDFLVRALAYEQEQLARESAEESGDSNVSS